MKNLRKVLALVLAMLLLAALAVPAFAAGSGSITINNAVSNHKYTAYKIFGGDVSDGKLSNIVWGNGISETGQNDLYNDYNLTATEDKTAAKVAEAIGTTDANAITFANNIPSSSLQNGTSVTVTSGNTATFSNLDDGYYLITDEWVGSTGVEGKDYSIARLMVQLVGTAVVNNKADKPTVEKKIVEGSNLVDDSTENIGDTVNYKVTSKVPEYDGYKEYYMDFTDVLSKGLTYTKTGGTVSGVTVKIGSYTLTASDFTVTVDDGTDSTSKVNYTNPTDDSATSKDATKITIKLKDFVSRHNNSVTANENDNTKPIIYNVGDNIEITYAAVVNDAAVIGNTGNPNKVKLDYSNNPLNSGDGTPDNENDGVKGNTPWDEVKSYVTEIDLTKVIAGTSTPLAGAVFNVKGSQINKVLITGQYYKEDTSFNADNYYLLTNNTYTKQKPNETTKANYANLTDGALPVTKSYSLVDYAAASVQETNDVDFQVVSNASGKVKITGLKEGTYTITEIQAPAGYNKLPNAIKISVTSNLDAVVNGTESEFKWKVNASSNENATVAVEMNESTPTDIAKDGTYQFNVENNSGTQLPSTGGIGTTIFYVAGSILVLAAVILLVTKRRMSADD